MEHKNQMLPYLYDETRSLKEALEAGRININQFRGFLVHSEKFFEEEIKKDTKAVPMSVVEAEAKKRAEEDALFDAFVRHHRQAPPPPPAEEEAEEEAEHVPCGCPSSSSFWKPCVHECSVCLKALTLKDSEGICWMCEEDLVTVPNDYPEDAAAAKQNSRYRDGAFHALVLRIRANNCREAADDTDDAEQVRECLEEAKRLDARASDLLYNTADGTFEPWWFTSWDYWMQPGSSYNGDKFRFSRTADVPAPCGIAGHTISIGTLFCLTCWPSEPAEVEAPEHPSDCFQTCNIVNGFHVGFCKSPPLHVEEVADDLASVAAKSKPDYKHALWPSPRPKLFAKACAPKQKFAKHQDALEFLAKRAKMTVDELLELHPSKYAENYMREVPEYWNKLMRKTPWWYNGP